jgi:hypothetical protein
MHRMAGVFELRTDGVEVVGIMQIEADRLIVGAPSK